MNRKVTKILLVIFSAALVLELAFVGFMQLKKDETPGGELPASDPTETVSAEATELPTEADETQTPTEETLPAETEPTEQRYVLTFAGDCTLGSTAAKWNASSSFVQVVGSDYDYPFKNVVSYFEEDDFTIVNLEGPLTETGTAAAKTFAFKGPTAYTQILTGSSVEAVTLANNHSEDYGAEGYKNTAKALNEANVAYVEHNNTTLIETDSGLKIGLYAASFYFDKADMTTDIAALRRAGAEIVICAFHWGTEGAYRPNSTQEYFGRAAIEAGADIVYGSHPHVLQKVEQYQDGYIFYSLGNFSFGGSTFPQDYDSAILQMEVIRDEEGVIRLGELTMIPVSVSSMKNQNNYQPTPMAEGTKEYDRVISKLNGTFTGPDLVVDYSSITGATEPPAATAPAEPTVPGATEGNVPGATEGATGETTGGSSGSEGGDATGGESGGSAEGGSGENPGGESSGNTGGDSGSTGGGESGGTSGGESGAPSGDGSGGTSGGESGGSSADSGSAEG